MLFSDYNKLFFSQQLYLFFQTEVSTTEMPPTSTPEMVVPTEATKEKTTEIIIIVVTVCSVLIVLCIIIFVIIYRWVHRTTRCGALIKFHFIVPWKKSNICLFINGAFICLGRKICELCSVVMFTTWIFWTVKFIGAKQYF